ncbi:hypothetical protein B4923_16090 [Brenneria roseae subsp. americana]|uniref:Uncharacterized protein n=1 Tax=Brenneria roseae subsp. americana TaxID=1508507 RepID=A0A2U1TMJ6_9GAMM|nr:hypothetical protein [Brenneria roseae]PWC10640.1 hypothetical protein B4923_16090 [Brenneria roseae subsp. americana]
MSDLITPDDLPAINELNEFTDKVPELQINTDVLGGTDGPANFQARALSNRTKYLKTKLEEIKNELNQLSEDTENTINQINQDIDSLSQNTENELNQLSNDIDQASQSANDSMKKSANGSDIDDAETFRENLGLKNAALATVISSLIDSTAARLMSVGAFGLGGVGIRIPAGTDVLTYLSTAQSGKYSALGTNPSTPTSSEGWMFELINFNNSLRGVFATPATITAASHRVFYNCYNGGVWSGWSEFWTNRNLQNPLTAAGAQTITGVKVFSYDGAGIVLRPVSTNMANFIRGQTEAGVNTWWIGRGSNTTADVSLLNESGGAYIRLLQNGNIQLNVATTVTINGVNVLTENTGVTTSTAQTITGTKTFSQNISIVRTSFPGIELSNTGIAAGTVGRYRLITASLAGALQIYSRSAGDTTTNQTVINIPTAATGTALVTGNNAVADSSGFWKTASPVINIYADGSFTATDDAEGVAVERLSEGTYKITGCAGMHPDAAWNGIDGGVTNPRCRNGLELTWNDFDVEPDGSVIVRIYHRPHPDAISFARNEIDGYENGDLIDVPKGFYIQVRVNMPERENTVETQSVRHSNVYCGTVSPSFIHVDA